MIVRARDLLQEHYSGLVKVFRFVSDLIKFVAIALCFGLDHIFLCVYPDKDHVYTQLCPHEVSPAIENADLLSFSDARDGVMAQDKGWRHGSRLGAEAGHCAVRAGGAATGRKEGELGGRRCWRC